MNLEDLFDKETIVRGIADGVAKFLATTDAAGQFSDLVDALRQMKLLKEGVLTPDQAAALFGVARRTWDRKVAEGQFRKRDRLGSQQPVHLLLELFEDFHRPPGHGLSPETGEPVPALTVVDLTGPRAVVAPKRRRGRPRHADRSAA